MYFVIKTRYERNSACTNTHSNMFSSFGDQIYGWMDRHNTFQVSFCFMCYIHGNGINSVVAPPQSCNKTSYHKYGNSVWCNVYSASGEVIRTSELSGQQKLNDSESLMLIGDLKVQTNEYPPSYTSTGCFRNDT